jgi:CTP synthase (UTP-ammonia lyase)
MINLECNTLPLIDEDLMAMRRKHEKEVEGANLKLSEEVKQELAQLDIKLKVGITDLPGLFQDEVTLLTNIAIKYFQCFLEMDYIEQEQCENNLMRYYGTLSLNGRVVGKGFGSNKKQVKFVASRLALQNIAPTLFEQWFKNHQS